MNNIEDLLKTREEVFKSKYKTKVASKPRPPDNKYIVEDGYRPAVNACLDLLVMLLVIVVPIAAICVIHYFALGN